MFQHLAILFITFFILIGIRVPVAVALALAAILGMYLEDIAPVNCVLQLYRGLDAFPILAVPFFLSVGILVEATSVGPRLLRLSALIVGRIRGSIGHINVVVSMLFAGISGAATADASGIGAVMVPMMLKRGYQPDYSAAITGISAVIGSIIPPSILMIIYGAFCNVSIGALFLGGLLPGFLMGLSYMGLNYVHATKHQVDQGRMEAELLPGGERSEQAKNASRVILESLPSLLVPLLIIAGITGGAFTATEAGMVALVYLVILSWPIYREVGPAELWLVFKRSVGIYSVILLAGGTATVFGWVITIMGAPEAVEDIMRRVSVGAFGYQVVVILILLVIGTFLDPLPAIIIFSPIFLTAADALGIHPIQLGVVEVMTLALGMVTPPYGLVLLITAKLANCSVLQAAWSMVPFWLVTIGVILLVAAFQGISLWIPKLIMPTLFGS